MNSHSNNLSPHWIDLPMTEEHAKDLCCWMYAPPYNIYQFPAWEEALQESYEIADPVIRSKQYTALLNPITRHLEGFIQLFPLEGWTRLGMGLHPAHCGRGKGRALAELAVKLALRQAPDKLIDLEVLTWNERAIRAYTSAGFRIEQSYPKWTTSGLQPCYCMVYEKSP